MAAELAKAPRILLNQIWLSLESLGKVISATSFKRWVGLISLFLLLNLRCLVRERFVTFLQTDYPQCLPHTRHGEMQGSNPGSVLG